MLRENCGCVLDTALDEWRGKSFAFGFHIDRLDWRSGGLRLDDLPFKYADEFGELEDGFRACLCRSSQAARKLFTISDLLTIWRPCFPRCTPFSQRESTGPPQPSADRSTPRGT